LCHPNIASPLSQPPLSTPNPNPNPQPHRIDSQVHYLLEPTSDYIKSAVNTVCELHREDVPGDVLVFLTGQEEVEAAVKLLREEGERLRGSRLQYRLLPLPLYSGALRVFGRWGGVGENIECHRSS